MAEAKDRQVNIRVSNGDRERLDRLVEATGEPHLSGAIRALLAGFASTGFGRMALPAVVEHGRQAETAATKRREFVRALAALPEVEPGSLWPDDPGTAIDLSAALDPSLPPPPSRVERDIERGRKAEAKGWDRDSLATQVASLRQQARHRRSVVLAEALADDGFGGYAMGWQDVKAAERVLNVATLVRPPRTGAPPLAVVIAVGANEAETRQDASARGHSRVVRSTADLLEVPPAVIAVARHHLRDATWVDLNRLVHEVRAGTV